MSTRYIREEGWVFRHEADDELLELCSDFESGKLSEAEAREALKPYAEFIDLAEFEDVDDEGSGFGFPFMCDDPEFRPATSMFEAWAADQKIPGVHRNEMGTPSPASGDIDYVLANASDALKELQERAAGRYEIVEGQW